ncbi:MAG: hypothetical protein KDD53_00730 [Bdellovibrionales bacterium]|nr:hypothetical protein [Bdellovibrionales bacterium]
MNQGASNNREIVLKACESFGAVPSMFGVCIRPTFEAFRKGKNLSPHPAHFLLKRSPTLRSSLYFAVADMHEVSTAPTLNNLLDLCSLDEVAAVVALSFVKSRFRRMCNKEQMEQWLEKLPVELQIGHIVGSTLTKVGGGGGMVIAGMNYLSCLLFLSRDKKGFQSYQHKLKSSNLPYDIKIEHERWQCDHQQIASHLVQLLGFGLAVGIGLGAPAEELAFGEDADEQALYEEIISWRVAREWIAGLSLFGEVPPVESKDDPFYLPADAARELHDKVKEAKESGTGFGWLLKSRSDLPAEVSASLKIPLIEEEDETLQSEVEQESQED